MKPLRLTLEGLQSYRDRQTIDFSLIQKCGLFGIFGPTGSGKSTILDAMTLALFGSVTRASHNTQGIINSACDSLAVSLTFELHLAAGRQAFRIDRTYRRKPKVLDSCEPRLCRLVRLADASGAAGQVLADKPTEVNAAVEKLLGLHPDDFTRAVVLPQNQFQQFLLLGRKDKSDMLERLFGLEEYGRDLSRKIALSRRRAEDDIGQAAGALDILQDCTDEAVQALQEEAAARTLERQEANVLLEAFQARYLAGKDLIQLIRQRQRLAAEQEILARQAEAVETDRRRLARALAAEPIWPAWLDHRDLTAETSQLQENLRHLDSRTAELQRQLSLNRELLRIDQELNGPRRTDLDRQIRQQELAAGLAGQIEDLAVRTRRILTEQNANIKLEQDAQARVMAGQTQIARVQQQLGQLRQARQERTVDPAWRQDLEKWLQIQQNREKLSGRQSELITACQKMGKEILQLQISYQHAGLALTNDQAALAREISEHLQEGEGCPVCGSRHHPQPAHLQGLPSAGASDRPGRSDLHRQLAQAAAMREASQRQLDQVSQEVSGAEAAAAELLRRRPRLKDIPEPDQDLRQLYRWESEAGALDRQIQAAESESGKLQDESRLAANRHNQLSGLLAGQKQLLQEMAGQQEQLNQALAALMPDVPADARQLEPLQRSLQDLRRIRGELEQASVRLHLLNRQLEDLYKPLELESLACRTRLSVAAGRLSRLAGQMAAAVRAAGFADGNEMAQARLEPDKVPALSEKLRQHDDSWRDLELQLRACDSQLQGRRLDEAAWQQLETGYQAAVGTLTRAARADDLAAGRLAELLERQVLRRRKAAESAAALARRDRIAQIDALVRGNAFVQYVAEERLRAIIAEASEYLQTMTRYRFALELDSDLSFVIRDQMNGGEVRPATTLSGGETFMASLALALALSSQIQIRGQSRLEFFFLDEGFGSLDSDLLDQVMDSLERISSPQRLIGLISHVPELRNRIGTRLVIAPANSRAGSQISLEQA